MAKLSPKFTKTMSRIGKQPVSIPPSVNVQIDKTQVTVTGPQGSLTLLLPAKIKVEVKDDQILITALGNDKQNKSNHGTTRAHLNNMVQGVVTPFSKQLEIRGTGYKASLAGSQLTLIVGFIHPVKITAPAGITFQVDDETKITVTGPDKTLVGQMASIIRQVKKPEPYQGKGIRYADEFIKLKPGKAAKTEA